MVRLLAAVVVFLVGVRLLDGKPFKNGFDLEKLSIPLKDIKGGGPRKDGIPAIDNPDFKSVEETSYLKDEDLIMSVSHNGVTRAYPIRILNHHEVVNDSIGDLHFSVTYCPLCGTGMVFNREIEGEVTTFGVSGLLYQSDVLLYDRSTESLWSQLMMKGISGEWMNHRLEWLASEFMTWSAWKQRHGDGEVLSRKTGARRNYSRNPYQGYEREEGVYFPVPLYRKELGNKDMILGVELDGIPTAYELDLFSPGKKYLDKIGGRSIKVSYNKETKFAQVTDAETGEAIPHVFSFWFAWQGFYPGTRLISSKKIDVPSSEF